jgi:hypothetical protein
MKAAHRIALLLLLIPLIASCGKKEVKQVSQESKTSLEAFEVADTIKRAYLRNDRSTIEENTTPEGYRQLISGMKSFDSAELTLSPTWVEIRDAQVKLSVSWKGTWIYREKVTEESGLAVFVFEGSPLKLAGIQRENPFSQPE